VIVGVGTDLVGVRRFETALLRTPTLRDRLFSHAERHTASGAPRSVASLAARFAAKEAAVKALGAPAGYRLLDCEVVAAAEGRPSLRMTGVLAEASGTLGVRTWHVSLTHDAGIAAAIVIAEGP
jgi:holo-[acyl-carrier protein] synthase